jgi:sulfonate transport system substrate-binding protein
MTIHQPQRTWRTLLTTALLLLSTAALADPAKIIRIGAAGTGTGGRPVQGGGSIGSVNIQGLLEEEFKKDGIKVEWSFFKGAGPAVNEALANKLIDFAWVGDLPTLIGKASGLKTKIILANGVLSHTYLLVPADSTATSIEDLKGKKIAVFKGTKMQLAANKILEQRGLSERDFKTINMDVATAQAALATKDIDGAWLTQGGFQLIDRGIAKIIYSTKGQPLSQTSQANLLVTEEFERDNPQLVQRLVKVAVKSAHEISLDANRDKTLQEWSKDGVPFSSWKKEYDGTSLKQRSSPLLDEFFIAFYKDALQSAQKYRMIRGNINFDQWIEPKYVNQAVKELKLESFWVELDAKGNPKAKRGG